MSNVKIGLLTILTRQLAGEMGTANPMEGANSIHSVARTSRGVSTFDPHALQRPITLAATAASEKVEIFQVERGVLKPVQKPRTDDEIAKTRSGAGREIAAFNIELDG